ncbi:MAG: DoxX family membrane protein [Paludibacter sp.]|nr:DoxX family membrane protein [Paludibacter sp.]
MIEKANTLNYSRPQLFALVTLRTLIGWYFLYEGLIKLFNSNWTSLGYLKDSKGWFAPAFNLLTSDKWLMTLVDFINIYGLLIIGLFLILGFFARYAEIASIIFLSLYYLSHPPLIDVNYMLPTEGSYLWVDKNLIILCAVVVLMLFPSSKLVGLDRLVFKKKK